MNIMEETADEMLESLGLEPDSERRLIVAVHVERMLSESLDIDDTARALDPEAFQTFQGGSMETRRNVAVLAAQRVRAAVLGSIQ